MTTNRKISLAFIVLNIGGVLLSVLYGMFGGSGGETTEGVYLGLFFTNLISVFFALIIALIKFSWWRSNFIWAVLILVIYYPISSVVIKNKIDNANKDIEPRRVDFGTVSLTKYITDKQQVQTFLKQQDKTFYVVDTLLYSKSLSKVFIICSVFDSSGVYQNFELFATLNNDVLTFHFPTGGNLISEDTSKSQLINDVIKWYVNSYSIDDEEGVNGLWNYQDFWEQIPR